MNLQQQIADGKDISKKILSALLSAGADKKKAKIAAEAVSLKTVQSLARESETYSDLSDPDKEATKKDLRILELNIQKEMATMQSNLQKEMATMQSNLQKEMATIKTDTIKWVVTMTLGSLLLLFHLCLQCFNFFCNRKFFKRRKKFLVNPKSRLRVLRWLN